MIAIIDYDAGNLKSVEKALTFLGEDVLASRDPAVLEMADRVILPGVGAFGDCMDKLRRYGLIEPIRGLAGSGKPLLGICLGMQVLFERSEESPGVEGLGILPGVIRRIPRAEGLKIPHIGWNSLDMTRKSRLLAGLSEHPYVYFVHSYYLDPGEASIVTSTVDYGARLSVSVEAGNIYATQFHPEKSSDVGLQILRNFSHIGE